MAIKLAAIVDALAAEFDARLVGDADLLIEGLSTLEKATSRDLTFLSHPKYIAQLAHSSAACVVVAPSFESAATLRGTCIVVDDPYYCFARITQIWKRHHSVESAPAIHTTAFIDPLASLRQACRWARLPV